MEKIWKNFRDGRGEDRAKGVWELDRKGGTAVGGGVTLMDCTALEDRIRKAGMNKLTSKGLRRSGMKEKLVMNQRKKARESIRKRRSWRKPE